MLDINYLKPLGLDKLVIGRKLFIRHRDVSKHLTSLKFKKSTSKKYQATREYKKNIEGGKRIHILHNATGVWWHIDNHN